MKKGKIIKYYPYFSTGIEFNLGDIYSSGEIMYLCLFAVVVPWGQRGDEI
jgi:hypothetical protein